MSETANELGRDLHHLGVQGDLPAIAAKLAEMGWVKRPGIVIGGTRLTHTQSNVEIGTIVVHGVDNPRQVALDISERIADERRR